MMLRIAAVQRNAAQFQVLVLWLQRGIAVAASVAISAGMWWAANEMLSGRGRGAAEVSIFEGQPGEMPALHGRIPAYSIRPDGQVILVGEATDAGDGRLQLRTFPARGSPSRPPGEAVLMPKSIETLWALASESDRDRIRGASDLFFAQFWAGVEEAGRSSEAYNAHLPKLQDAVRRAVRQAWQAPEVVAAFAAFADRLSVLAGRRLAQDLRPVVQAQTESAMWLFLRGSAYSVLETLSLVRPRPSALDDMVARVLADPRVRLAAANLTDDVLAQQEARALFIALTMRMVPELIAAPEFRDAIDAIMADPALQAAFEPSGESLLAVLRLLPEGLGGFGPRTTLNPLSASVVKGLGQLGSGQVMLFLEPEHTRRVVSTVGRGRAVLVRRVAT
jgi:hypothetical protein